jgi:serine/threonine-protein kinase
VIDIGSVLNGKYRLVRLVGDGGMGSVYEGLHLVLGTRVAIKLLHPDLARRTGLVERFLQEARVSAQIRSPHVVQVTDVDRTPEGHAYLVMELLEGEPLSSVLERQRRLPVPTACEYTTQILSALEAAHALGVIHRDLKPENVFVTFAAGRPVLKLIDFGIAKARRTDPQQKNLTVAGVVMGTAEYMAPEQARSAAQVDARADLYAVGVMLYEMLSGARPVSGDDARIIALKVERGEITPLVQRMPDVPRELAGLVHRAMAPRPEMRFASATEMRLALEQAATGKRGTAQAVAASASSSVGPVPPVGELSATGTLKNVSAAQVLGAAANRSGTAAMPQVQQVGPMGPMGPMGPVPTPPGASDGYEPAPRTERAGPAGTGPGAPVYDAAALGAPPGYPAAYTPEPPASPHRRRPHKGVVIALVSLSLLLGAGVVVMLISSGALSSSNDTPPTKPLSFGSVDAGSGPEATGASPTSTPPSVVPTLSTGRPVPGPTPPGPGPGPHPQPRPAAEDGGGAPPPFVFPTGLPSTLPAIPSIFPLPSGFPTAFPSVFPPWPSPAPTAPPAPPAPRGSTI